MNMHHRFDASPEREPEKKVSTEDFLRNVDFEIEQSAKPQEKIEHWRDKNPTTFTAKQRAHTTILHAGLTMAHDLFIQSAFRGLG